ncbi:dTMP kinase [Thermoproteota archaeon]
MTKYQGYFITFEGIEGVGKSTQMQKLAQLLKQKNKPFLTTKEPGGTAAGQAIRAILLDNNTHFSSNYTELLLFYADRLENIEVNIKPALQQGHIVLSDRFCDSSYAYQIGARHVPEPLVEQLDSLSELKPDLTLLFDGDPEKGLQRAAKRSPFNRFEKEKLDFHTRVRQAYLDLAKKEPARFKVIPVDNRSIDEIFNDVLIAYLDLTKDKK